MMVALEDADAGASTHVNDRASRMLKTGPHSVTSPVDEVSSRHLRISVHAAHIKLQGHTPC